jgi:hypothetical protein
MTLTTEGGHQMKRIAVIALIALVGASISWAQGSPAEDVRSPKLTPGGIDFRNAQSAFGKLFDSKQFSMSHTLGLSFNSGSTGGANQYYLNTMTYQFTPNLTAVAQVGVQNTLGGTPIYGPSGSRARVIVPNLGLLYTPSPSVRIEIRMSQRPNYGYYRGYYRHSDYFYDAFIER